MPLILSSDPSHAGGGYAILQVEGAAAPATIAIEDRSTGLFLAPGGRWTKRPNDFEVEKIDQTRVRLGPDIVDHVEADAILALHAQGEALGVVVWPAIRPSAGVGSGDVMPDQAEMAIVGAIGDSPTPPPSPPVAPTSASTDLAPLPPPPPPPVRAEVAAKPAEPVRRVGLLKQILIANALILLILGIFAFRGTETARGLVCEPTGALHEIGIAKTLVGCAEKAAVNPEETAYNDYLQCVPGQPACAQKRCGDAYLSAFANGAHATKVRAASAASQQACEADAEKQSAAEVFAAFNECMRTTPNVCNRSQCVDRYRYKLTTEPYASSLRQAAETAAGDCRRSQEDAAYAQFNSCVAGADACDAARCASAFTSGFPNSAYVSRVLQAAENAARTCRQATEPQGLADCDQYAANRFDADRPTNASFVEDAATLSDESIETGLRACASADVNMSGGRRVYLQRGRLLAERAVRRARNGDFALADDDMADAIKNWRTAEGLGSAYAANVLGTLFSGSFNRASGREFIAADLSQAIQYWSKAARAGNVNGERNLAAYLLTGNGVQQDVQRAVSLLVDAFKRGDEKAAAILGVALYTGYPAAIGKDRIEGWRLVKRGACADKTAKNLIEQEISKGRQPASERPTCN